MIECPWCNNQVQLVNDICPECKHEVLPEHLITSTFTDHTDEGNNKLNLKLIISKCDDL
ncbi:hypothetical protein PN4B1_05580 [Paenibacillus naphthalenovorans]|uniref:Uncharacterized protein n=1 Tax=Paenibacillus naphthalenovorans TaxID=162209 RepID=A0A0U2W8T4_9BACL|nr:hypothetical protein IJ22_24890 [Paenibacillus naphthalenovorans]GCL70656.1 hypothetical protein PN4B1_05580 [Paenibacillus naphthalenovorans]SDH75824.1 hypothetical protein SAMN05421868_1013 [Paenibacillus naphthalenovorans]